MRTVFTMPLDAGTVCSVFRLEPRNTGKVGKVLDGRGRLKNNVPTVAAVSTVGTATRDEFFTPE